VLAVLAGLAVVWVGGIVLLPASVHTADESPREIIISSESDPLFERICFDCHSNQVDYPWFTRIPLVSLVVGHQVSSGRDSLNFSNWNELDRDEKAGSIEHSLEVILDGTMPPLAFRFLNKKSRMTFDEFTIMTRDANRALEKLKQ